MLTADYWESIADNLSKAGWSLGWVSAVDSHGPTIWIADAHRGDGRRYIVRSDEKLTAFLELEAAIRRGDSLDNVATQLTHYKTNSFAIQNHAIRVMHSNKPAKRRWHTDIDRRSLVEKF